MAQNDIIMFQENSSNDYLEVVVGSVSTGKAIMINASNKPIAKGIEISDVDSLTAALSGKVSTSQLGVANGVATLGGDGKVKAAQLPASVVGAVSYQGSWNASTNTPTIPSAASGNKGYYYVVSTAGSTNIDGITDWKISDWIISNGTTWEKVDNTDSVTSIAGKTGAVTLAIADISGLSSDLNDKAPKASPTFTGTVTLPSTTSIGTVSSTELGYLDDVTSPLQTQINSKQATVTGGASSIVSSNLTASKALVSDASGKVAVSTATAIEVSYLVGVTQAIQTQLNGKQASLGYTAENTANKNAINGYCGLDSGGKVATAQLPASIVKWVSAPATPTSTGTAGEASYDNDYLYICVATNSWKRMPLAIWV